MTQTENRCVVLKVGGSLGGDSGPAVIQAIATLRNNHHTVVVVHGGGQRISAALTEAGVESTFVNGQRVTSATAMNIVEQVLAVEINREIVEVLRTNGLPAIAVSGADDLLFCTPIPELDRAARVHAVQPGPLNEVFTRGEVPVVAPVGRDESGLHYNVNADLAAAAIAGALQAEKIVFLTDVAGIYADFSAGDLLTHATDAELRQLTSDGSFESGMIPKVESVLAALDAGVQSAYVVNGRELDAVLWAVRDETHTISCGTRITRERSNVHVL